MELTPAQLACFERDGFLIFPDLFSQAEIAVLKNARTLQSVLRETTLFLHQAVDDLPVDKRKLLSSSYKASSELAGRKVLIVDDDVRNIFALSGALEQHGMTVLSAVTAALSVGSGARIVWARTGDAETPAHADMAAMHIAICFIGYLHVPSPASTAALLAVCSGGFSNGSATRAGGVGTAAPPSLRAMMRLVFSNFTVALEGGTGPSAIPVPP